MSEELKHEIKVTSHIFRQSDGMHIGIDTLFPSGQVFKQVVNMQDEAIKEQLKRLGWKAPDEPRHQPITKEEAQQAYDTLNSIPARMGQKALQDACRWLCANQTIIKTLLKEAGAE